MDRERFRGAKRREADGAVAGRRRFLRAMACAACAVACGCVGGPKREEIAERARSYDAELDCRGAEELSPDQRRRREQVDYRQRAEEIERSCFVCADFIEPRRAGNCGRCRTVPGPIHPLGSCRIFRPQLA